MLFDVFIPDETKLCAHQPPYSWDPCGYLFGCEKKAVLLLSAILSFPFTPY